MEELDKALAEVTTGLAELTRQVGPEAVEATFTALRVGAAVNLLGAGAVLLLVMAGLAATYRMAVKARQYSKKDPYGMGDVHWGTGAIMLGIASGISGILAVIVLLDPANWIALYDPAAAIAWRLLEKL
jgi:hypothetical protein